MRFFSHRPRRGERVLLAHRGSARLPGEHESPGAVGAVRGVPETGRRPRISFKDHLTHNIDKSWTLRTKPIKPLALQVEYSFLEKKRIGTNGMLYEWPPPASPVFENTKTGEVTRVCGDGKYVETCEREHSFLEKKNESERMGCRGEGPHLLPPFLKRKNMISWGAACG